MQTGGNDGYTNDGQIPGRKDRYPVIQVEAAVHGDDDDGRGTAFTANEISVMRPGGTKVT